MDQVGFGQQVQVRALAGRSRVDLVALWSFLKSSEGRGAPRRFIYALAGSGQVYMQCISRAFFTEQIH